MMRLYTIRNSREFKEEEDDEPIRPKITYKVMLIDYFEGEWIDLGEGYDFTDKDMAIQKRDERNLKEFKTATPSHNHYCVIEMENSVRKHEIECPATFKS